MSAEGATALYERLSADEGFRAQLEAAETPDDKRRIVVDAGYDVSRDDLPTVRNLAGVTDLSDEDLEKVAGGASGVLDPVLEGEGAGVVIGAVGGAAAAAMIV